jgi:hypothetical protein
MPRTGWAADGAEVRRVLIALAVVCALLPVEIVVKLALNSDVLFPDFFALWSWGRFVLTHAPATIYDDRTIFAFHAEQGMPDGLYYPFWYPPWILLLLAPLGALPYPLARAGWLVVTFALYLAALAAWRWERKLVVVASLAPSSAICFLVGHNGFLSAALMLGGLRLLRSRPMTAGALLAALAYKPQLAVLAPFVLLFGRHWRAMAGAALAVCVLSLAVTVAFGPEIWGAWMVNMRDQAMGATPRLSAQYDKMPTVNSAVLLLGGTMGLARAAQVAGACAGIFALWRVRGRVDAEANAVLALSAILATPYAFLYDLPVTTGAVLAVIAARIAAKGQFGSVEFPLLLGCVILPVVLVARAGPLAAVVPAVFAALVYVFARERYGGAAVDRVPGPLAPAAPPTPG